MITRRTFAALSSALILTITACSEDAPDADTTSSPTQTTVTATSTTQPTSETSTSEVVTEEPAAEAEPESVPSPEPVEPQSIWPPVGEGYNCPSTDAWVWDPSDCNPTNGIMSPSDMPWLNEPDPSTIPVWQGGECSYAVCGYPPGEPAPGTMQAEVAERCRSGELVGAGCEQYL